MKQQQQQQRDLPKGISQSTLDHFSRIPFANTTLRDPAFRIFPSSRSITDSGRGHTLTGKTWNSPGTIRELLSFWRPGYGSSPGRPSNSLGPPPSSTSSPDSSSSLLPHHQQQQSGDNGNVDVDLAGQIHRFYTFGSDLNAHPDLLHGGVIATILDSTLGNAIVGAFGRAAATGGMFTVELKVGYLKPVRTPGTVRVRAWVVRVEERGRKVWAEAVVESEGEGEGGVVVHARGEGMWMRARRKGEMGEGTKL